MLFYFFTKKAYKNETISFLSIDVLFEQVHQITAIKKTMHL